MDPEISKELDYKKFSKSVPSYKLSKLVPISGSQSVTVTSAGGQECVFEIPPNAVNLSKSFLQFSFTPAAAGADYFTWIYKNCLSLIRQVQLYTRSGLFLCDLNEVGNYTNMVWPAEINIEEFKQYDTFSAGSGYGCMIRPNNCLTFNVLTSTSITAKGANTATVTTALEGVPSLVAFDDTNAAVNGKISRPNDSVRPNNTASSVSFTEPQYIEVNPTVNDGGLTWNVNFPLGLLFNTIFSVNKDILFNEVMMMKVVFNSTSKIAFKSKVVASATAAGPTDPTQNVAAYTGNVAVTNLGLYVAMERNQEIVNTIREKILTGGFSLMYPAIWCNKASLTGTSQNVTLRFGRSHGLRLIKNYHSVYDSTESSNTAYNHSNLAAAKVTSFYTMLNNNRLQDQNIACANGDDYLMLSDKLRGSLIQNSNIYNFNHLWIDDFSNEPSPSEKIDESNIAKGIPLDIEVKYDYLATVVNGTYIHYDYSVTQRMLNIGQQGISIN